jgi:hypothetical protein
MCLGHQVERETHSAFPQKTFCPRVQRNLSEMPALEDSFVPRYMQAAEWQEVMSCIEKPPRTTFVRVDTSLRWEIDEAAQYLQEFVDQVTHNHYKCTDLFII